MRSRPARRFAAFALFGAHVFEQDRVRPGTGRVNTSRSASAYGVPGIVAANACRTAVALLKGNVSPSDRPTFRRISQSSTASPGGPIARDAACTRP